MSLDSIYAVGYRYLINLTVAETAMGKPPFKASDGG
jgi:hypothetical protein